MGRNNMKNNKNFNLPDFFLFVRIKLYNIMSIITINEATIACLEPEKSKMYRLVTIPNKDRNFSSLK
jgi:hypothetical protein